MRRARRADPPPRRRRRSPRPSCSRSPSPAWGCLPRRRNARHWPNPPARGRPRAAGPTPRACNGKYPARVSSRAPRHRRRSPRTMNERLRRSNTPAGPRRSPSTSSSRSQDATPPRAGGFGQWRAFRRRGRHPHAGDGERLHEGRGLQRRRRGGGSARRARRIIDRDHPCAGGRTAAMDRRARAAPHSSGGTAARGSPPGHGAEHLVEEGPVPLAARKRDIAPLHVKDLLARPRALEAAGRTIINLELGEPDFPTTMPIVEAGIQALREGRTHYTPALGLPALREAISEVYRTEHGVEVSPERIVITPGASGALQLALAVLVNTGSKVLMADPVYPCNRHLVRLLEGETVAVPVDASTRFQPTAEQVARHW